MAIWDGIDKAVEEGLGIELNNLPLVGSAFPNQNEKDLEAKQREIAAEYAALGPQHAQAQQQSMQNSMAAFVPMNRMIGSMMGPQAQTNFGEIFQPVLPEGHPGNPPNVQANGQPVGTLSVEDARAQAEAQAQGRPVR